MCSDEIIFFKTHQSIHGVFTEHRCEGIIEVPKGQTSSQLKVDLKTVTDKTVKKSRMNLFQVLLDKMSNLTVGLYTVGICVCIS